MEDYKKKYEQALENFKKLKAANKDNKELVYFIEYEYPELKESEDEKIRNLIYCLIRDRSDNGKLLEHNGCSVEKALAWLEKRVENLWKPSDEQMKALQVSIGIVGELTSTGECLKELVEQLKKLREE